MLLFYKLRNISTVFTGVNRLPEEFVENAKKESADVVLISSLNGEAAVDNGCSLGHIDIILVAT